ncbi:PRC-barrel domain-containing protein [Dermatophilaceae bacterium Sec6.4]|nr:PRC-barrel domain-containing protein [Actinomycetota bacterium]
MPDDEIATLYTLGDRGQTIEGVLNDVRGRTVRDIDGAEIGMVADLLVDDQEHKVRFMVVEHSGFLGMGETRTLLPVETITSITTDEVLIDQSSEKVASAPEYDPDLVDDHPHHVSVHKHYGSNPYRGSGAPYPIGGGGMGHP